MPRFPYTLINALLLILVPGTILIAEVINLWALAGWLKRQWERLDFGYPPVRIPYVRKPAALRLLPSDPHEARRVILQRCLEALS
jgi:hypothetical protein